MTKQLTFLASYPQKKKERDGMMQRIKHVDTIFDAYQRHYIDISLRTNFQKKHIQYSERLSEYKLNIILHFWFILNLLQDTSIIYIHSIYNLRWSLLLLYFLNKKQKLYLDVHGVVPEEQKLQKKYISSIFYNVIEKQTFKFISGAIFVTKSMQKHFEAKYPSTRLKQNIIYNILPNSFWVSSKNQIDNDSKIVVIYSGNCQKWQNIDLMLEVIIKNQADHIEYIILTGEPEIFYEKFKKISFSNIRNTSILSVTPSDLNQYYAKAHYGFILRDDIIVNRVANPTKMIEYLSNGIIPIVKSEHIGDFEEYNYDYISFTDFNTNILPRKSKHNIEIAQKIIETKNDLEGFVMQ